jgi:hypothetical protein
MGELDSLAGEPNISWSIECWYFYWVVRISRVALTAKDRPVARACRGEIGGLSATAATVSSCDTGAGSILPPRFPHRGSSMTLWD